MSDDKIAGSERRKLSLARLKTKLAGLYGLTIHVCTSLHTFESCICFLEEVQGDVRGSPESEPRQNLGELQFLNDMQSLVISLIQRSCWDRC